MPTTISSLPAAALLDDLLLLGLAAEAADGFDLHRETGEAIAQRLLVLEREDRRRREERDLLAVHHRLERGAHRDLGLAVADVAAQQAVHRGRRFHVALDVGDRVPLIHGQFPFEGVFELLLPVRVRAERVTRDRLARGVELQQLLGHVAHRLLDAGLGLFPGRAAEPIEGGPRRAGVALHEVEPLHRDEELVLARVAELHELLRLEADVDPLEPDEHADAVIDVDDEVADLEVAEVGEEGAGGGLAPLVHLPFFLEDVGLGPELQAGVRQTEAAGQPADADQHRGGVRVLGALHRHGEDRVVGEQLDGALGAALRVGHEHHRVAALPALLDVGDPILQAAAELPCRLRGNVPDAAFLTERQRLERGTGVEPRLDVLPVDD